MSNPSEVLREALTELVKIIDAAGLANLSDGVQLGQTSWYVKASDRMEFARRALEGRPSLEMAPEQPADSETAVQRPADERLLDALTWILPMAKAHAHAHPVGRNAELVQNASDVLKETQRSSSGARSDETKPSQPEGS